MHFLPRSLYAEGEMELKLKFRKFFKVEFLALFETR